MDETAYRQSLKVFALARLHPEFGSNQEFLAAERILLADWYECIWLYPDLSAEELGSLILDGMEVSDVA